MTSLLLHSENLFLVEISQAMFGEAELLLAQHTADMLHKLGWQIAQQLLM
jgi:hypothetical protein